MTGLEIRLLEILRAGPPRKVHELAAELPLGAHAVEAALRQLERARLVRRGEDLAHVVVWHAVAEALAGEDRT